MANYCIYCGALLGSDAQLCPRCGRLIPEVETPPEQPAAAAPEHPAAPPAPAVQEEPAALEAPAPQPQQAEAEPAEEAEKAVPPPAAPARPPVPPEQPEPKQEPRQPAQPPREAPRTAAPKYVPTGMPMGRQMGLPQADLLTTGGVLGMVLLGLLPLVGWIVLLVWAFDAASGPNHRALAKGLLLAKLIVGVLAFLLICLMGFLLAVSPYYWY